MEHRWVFYVSTLKLAQSYLSLPSLFDVLNLKQSRYNIVTESSAVFMETFRRSRAAKAQLKAGR